MKFAPILVSLLLAAGTCHAADGKRRPPPDELLSIPSRTITDEQFLKGDAVSGAPVTLGGDLRLPNWNERLPVVVLVHGSDGPTSGAVAAWRAILEKQGVATVRLDYFSGRGITEVETDQRQMGFLNGIYDVYRTVEILAADNRVDGHRIALMGFSRGGTIALYAAMKRFHRAYGPKRGRIAVYLPFYAGCSFGLLADTDMVDAPIRAFHGELDDWVPAKPCQDLIGRIQAGGRDATLTIFPGAHHAFDNPRAKPGGIIPLAQTPRRCHRDEIDGLLVNTATGKPFTYDDACVELGPTAKYNEAAAAAAAQAVDTILHKMDE